MRIPYVIDNQTHALAAEQIEFGLPREGELESLAGLWADGEPLPSLEEMQAQYRGCSWSK